MLFNWFTFLAQIINFLILVYLLWRFLYRPITRTMGERKKQLERRWQEAEQEREAAHQEAENYRRQQQELAAQREEIFNQTKEHAEQERRSLLRQARTEVSQRQEEWQRSLQQQQDTFLEDLRQRIAQETYRISRRALRDLANADLEQQAIAVFIDRLRKLGEAEPENGHSLLNSLQTAQQDIEIRSSFEIPEAKRQKILDILNQKQILDDKNVQFTTSPDLIFGIQLQVGHRQITWDLQTYLQDLEARFSSVFEQTTREQEAEEQERQDEQQTRET